MNLFNILIRQNPACGGVCHVFLEVYIAFKKILKAYAALPILYIPVPQTGHLPFIAGLPFFIVTGVALGSSRFARHLTQYISAILSHLLSTHWQYISRDFTIHLDIRCIR